MRFVWHFVLWLSCRDLPVSVLELGSGSLAGSEWCRNAADWQ